MNEVKQIASPEKYFSRKFDMSASTDQWIEGYIFDDYERVCKKIAEYAKEVVKYTLQKAAEKGLVRCYSTEGKDEQSQPYFYFVDADETVKVDEQSILSLEDSIIKDLKL